MSVPLTPIQTLESIHGPTIGPDHLDISGVPLDPNLPIDYKERFYRLTQKPDFSDTVFAHIANGGTLITLADAWGVRFSDISNYIGTTQELREKYNNSLIARTEWEEERLLQELRAIATVDIRQAYNDNGTLKDIKEIPANVAAAIANIESDELHSGNGDDKQFIGYTRKVKFWDKAKAIELFMKKHGMLVDRHKIEVGARLEDLVSAANDEEVIDATVISETKQENETPQAPVSGVLSGETYSESSHIPG